MKKLLLPLALLFAVGQVAMPTLAQTDTKKPAPAKTTTIKKKKPLKNEISKLKRARKEDRTVRQVTVNPKKNPAKDVSKNVNNELNRESKDINHFFQGKKKKK